MLAISPVEPPRPFAIQEPAPEVVPETPWTASDVWVAARNDLAAVPLEIRCHMRYLALAEVPQAERWKRTQVLAGHVNSLSTETQLLPLVAVPNSNGRLVRINLFALQIDPKTWEKLAGPEPYYHRTIEWPGGVWPLDKKSYSKGSFLYRAPGPWVAVKSPDAVANLTSWTESNVPIVRADFFIWQVAIQDGRSPGYYDFLRIKNLADFQNRIRYNAENSKDLTHKRTILWSGIVRKNVRLVERDQTVLGGYHKSGDVAKVAKTRNPLEFLLDDFTQDATEQFAPLPNGLPVWFLGNAKGEAQAVAPGNIVRGDTVTNPNDANLNVGLSCIYCHAGMNKKERIVKDFTPIEANEFTSYDYKKYLELQRLYKRELNSRYELDRQAYEAAIKEATYGLTAYEYANGLRDAFIGYDNRRVDLEQISREVGYPVEQVRQALQSYHLRIKLPGSLSVLLRTGGALPVEIWHEFVGEFYDVLYAEGLLK